MFSRPFSNHVLFSIIIVLLLVHDNGFADTPLSIFVRLNSEDTAPYYVFSATENGEPITINLERGKTYNFTRTDYNHTFNLGSAWLQPMPGITMASTSSTDIPSDGVGSIEFGQTLTVSIPIDFFSDSPLIYYCYAHSWMSEPISIIGSVEGVNTNQNAGISSGSTPLEEGVGGIAYHWTSHTLIENVEFTLVGMDGNNTSGNPKTTLSDSSGSFSIIPEADGTNHLTVSKPITDAETGSVISSADALAALKIAVGINPNNDPDGSGPMEALAISPYQYIASDMNSDGRVTSSDALAILKSAVNLGTAEPRRWVFVSEDYDFWNDSSQSFHTSNSNVTWERDGITLEYSESSAKNVVGILMGDVNGSWTSAGQSVKISDSHLARIVSSYRGANAQWGIQSSSSGENGTESGNESPDTVAPVISLIGDNPQTLEVNAAYIELGATSDTGETVNVFNGNVDMSTPGEYVVTYNVSDAADNAADEVSRIVSVVDSSAPITKHSVLTKIIDTVVIPNHKDVAERAESFASDGGAISDYCSAIGSDKESIKLDNARNSWKNLMGAVQKTELHIIGPSAKNSKSLHDRVYYYTPEQQLSTCYTDVAVEQLHNVVDFDVSAVTSNRRSLSAVEYLLFNDDLSHTCSSRVAAVADWSTLPESERKSRRCMYAKALAVDVAENATKIHSQWEATEREIFTREGDVGTFFELMTDGLYYFEKYSKSAKLNAPLGVDNLCTTDLTCPELVEAPFSETSLENIKVNAQQFYDIFELGLDSLADQRAGSDSWSSGFKSMILDVISKIDAILGSSPSLSLKERVDNITDTGDLTACTNAFANPESSSGPEICLLAGLMKKVTDDMKIEFALYLDVDLPEGAQGDND